MQIKEGRDKKALLITPSCISPVETLIAFCVCKIGVSDHLNTTWLTLSWLHEKITPSVASQEVGIWLQCSQQAQGRSRQLPDARQGLEGWQGLLPEISASTVVYTHQLGRAEEDALLIKRPPFCFASFVGHLCGYQVMEGGGNGPRWRHMEALWPRRLLVVSL